MKMQRVAALVRKELKKTARDPAVLFMIILFPVIMTVMFGLSFGQVGGGSSTVSIIGVVDLNAEGPGHHWSADLVKELAKNDMLEMTSHESNASALKALSAGELQAVIIIPEDFGRSCDSFNASPSNRSAWLNTTIALRLDKGSMIAMQAIPPMVQQALAATLVGPQAGAPSLPVGIGSETTDASKLKVFDYVAPGLFSFGAMFMIMIVAQTLTSEREQGLLRRMATTPLSASELMGAQALSYFILALIQGAVIFGMAFGIGYRPSGGPAALAAAFVIVSVFSLCCVGFGLITAALARSPGAATGISFIFIMPLMFLGTFVSAMAPTALSSTAGLVVPSHYVTESLTNLFLRGASPASVPVLTDLGILIAYSVGTLLVGIYLFRKMGKD